MIFVMRNKGVNKHVLIFSCELLLGLRHIPIAALEEFEWALDPFLQAKTLPLGFAAFGKNYTHTHTHMHTGAHTHFP